MISKVPLQRSQAPNPGESGAPVNLNVSECKSQMFQDLVSTFVKNSQKALNLIAILMHYEARAHCYVNNLSIRLTMELKRSKNLRPKVAMELPPDDSGPSINMVPGAMSMVHQELITPARKVPMPRLPSGSVSLKKLAFY